MAYCPNCGSPLKQNAAFCQNCGTRSGISEMVYTAPNQVSHLGQEISSKGNPNVLLGLLSFFLPLIGFILGIVYLSKPSDNDKHTGKLCMGLAVASVVLAILMLIVCSVVVNEGIFSAKDVELVDCEIESRTSGVRYIVGTVKNNSDYEYNYLLIEFNLYDDEGTLLDNTFDSIENFEPTEVWRFEVRVFEEDATQVEVEDISGY